MINIKAKIMEKASRSLPKRFSFMTELLWLEIGRIHHIAIRAYFDRFPLCRLPLRSERTVWAKTLYTDSTDQTDDTESIRGFHLIRFFRAIRVQKPLDVAPTPPHS